MPQRGLGHLSPLSGVSGVPVCEMRLLDQDAEATWMLKDHVQWRGCTEALEQESWAFYKHLMKTVGLLLPQMHKHRLEF